MAGLLTSQFCVSEGLGGSPASEADSKLLAWPSEKGSAGSLTPPAGSAGSLTPSAWVGFPPAGELAGLLCGRSMGSSPSLLAFACFCKGSTSRYWLSASHGSVASQRLFRDSSRALLTLLLGPPISGAVGEGDSSSGSPSAISRGGWLASDTGGMTWSVVQRRLAWPWSVLGQCCRWRGGGAL